MLKGRAGSAAAKVFSLSIGVFFIGGFVASSVSLLVPRVRLTLGLDYASAMAVQLASHSSYLVLAIPIAAAVSVVGYMRAHAIGLTLMAAGCGLLIAGLASQSFAFVLMPLLAVSAGASFLQIASNNVVTLIGDSGRAAVRLNILQGFNSLGTVVAPLVGAATIVALPARAQGIPPYALPFGCAAITLTVLALAFAASRNLLRGIPVGSTRTSKRGWVGALRDRRLVAGAAAIFAYVGAEVAIGALLTDFLMQPSTMALAPMGAARLVSLYWGGAMIGRFAGAWLMGRIAPARLLRWAAGAAGLLVIAAVFAHGPISGAALIGVGLFNSVMYPTIYVLALPTAPEQATPGATLLCMAVVGGAIIPPITGLAADQWGLAASLLLPASCYGIVLLFASDFLLTRTRR
ncbi:MFS transporter [Sphingomonas xinjiangensis]|uniref:FHS family L-fucose permease-like MFS transporter n=1 Tax=Sphingomonas xinjiangensis TaxID=643568 RepID=A0A840YEC0_9SPHN|nr:MFS transporter [Sphingomonas xinjiangensis]MBB5711787.1 FHS family L-fucose permease-like MFS transporter [Sphingomonas xinjiangensis]